MSNGISGYGTTLAGSVTGTIGEVIKISGPGMDVDTLDVSTMDSEEEWREFIAGFKNAGELSLDMLYEKTNLSNILAALGGDAEDWTVTLPDGSTFVCSGFISALGQETPHDDKISQTMTIKLSGKPEFTPATST